MDLLLEPLFGVMHLPFISFLVLATEFIKKQWPQLKDYITYKWQAAVVGLIMTILCYYFAGGKEDPEFMAQISSSYAASILGYDYFIKPKKKKKTENMIENEK